MGRKREGRKEGGGKKGGRGSRESGREEWRGGIDVYMQFEFSRSSYLLWASFGGCHTTRRVHCWW